MGKIIGVLLLMTIIAFFIPLIPVIVSLTWSEKPQKAYDAREEVLYRKKNEAVAKYVQKYFYDRETYFYPVEDVLVVCREDSTAGYLGTRYHVYFSKYTWYELKVYSLSPMETTSKNRSLHEKAKPANIRVHGRKKLMGVCKRERFNEKQAKAFISGIFQKSTSLLVELGQKAAAEGTVTVYGADFNKQQHPNKRELKIMQREFENAGFKVCRTNYRTGEITLSIDE